MESHLQPSEPFVAELRSFFLLSIAAIGSPSLSCSLNMRSRSSSSRWRAKGFWASCTASSSVCWRIWLCATLLKLVDFNDGNKWTFIRISAVITLAPNQTYPIPHWAYFSSLIAFSSAFLLCSSLSDSKSLLLPLLSLNTVLAWRESSIMAGISVWTRKWGITALQFEGGDIASSWNKTMWLHIGCENYHKQGQNWYGLRDLKSRTNLPMAGCVFLCVCSVLVLSLKDLQKPGLPSHQIASLENENIHKHEMLLLGRHTLTSHAHMFLARSTRWGQIVIRFLSPAWPSPGWWLVTIWASACSGTSPWRRLIRVWSSFPSLLSWRRLIRVWIMSLLDSFHPWWRQWIRLLWWDL